MLLGNILLDLIGLIGMITDLQRCFKTANPHICRHIDLGASSFFIKNRSGQ